MNKLIKFLLIGMLFSTCILAERAGATQVVVRGFISDTFGNPVPGYNVKVVLDGDTSLHINDIYTDSAGYYNDTLYTSDNEGIVLIYVYDCDNQIFEVIHSFDADITVNGDFQICYEPKTLCESNFIFIKDSVSNYTYNFYSNSVSSAPVISYLWRFGDNTTSTQQNPVHIFPDTGYYQVCLEIWSENGCYDIYYDSIKVTDPATLCAANYYFKKDTVTGLMNYYHFYDNSIPSDQIVSHYWDFDDGHSDTVENPNHQFKYKGAYNVTLYISTGTCTSSYSHRIVIQKDFVGTCNAYFIYKVDTLINKKEYSFTSQSSSVGSPIVAYYWNFGDGNISTQQNPTHVFQDIGQYKVELTILTQDSCISTYSKNITVGNPDYYFIGGQVFKDQFPISGEFDVILYRDINNYLEPVDTATFDTLAYYYFIDVAEGDYKVKAYPSKNSSCYNSTTPSYYYHEMFWDYSQSIGLSNSTVSQDIKLVNLSPNSGQGRISGKMYYNGSATTGLFPPGTNPSMASREIYLLDKQTGKPVRFTFTDAGGNYTLSDLDYGNYVVHADYAGKYCIPVEVTLSQANPVIDSANLEVGDQITGIVKDEITPVSLIGKIYPNPSADIFFLPLDLIRSADVKISVQNLSGQVVKICEKKYSAGKHNFRLDLSSLKKGMYLLEVETSDKQAKSRQKIISY